MLKQIKVVLWSYLTRPVAKWLIVALVLPIAALYSLTQVHCHTQRISPQLTRDGFYQVDCFGRAGQKVSYEDSLEELRQYSNQVYTLSIDRCGDYPFPDLSSFPNLTNVELRNGKFTVDDALSISRHPYVEAVKIHRIAKFNDPDVLAALGTKINQLEIQFGNDDEKWEALKELPELTGLELLYLKGDNYQPIDWNIVLKMPRLKTLVFDFPGMVQFSEEDLLKLKEHRTLKSCYINWKSLWPLQQDYGLEFRRQMHPVRLMPTEYDMEQIYVLNSWQIFFAILVGMIISVMGTHIVIPSSGSIPHYWTAHRIVPGSMILSAYVAATVVSTYWGIAWYAALSMMTLPGFVALVLQSNFVKSRVLQYALVVLIFSFANVAMLATLSFNLLGREFVSFIYGDFPGLAYGFIAIQAVLIGAFFYRMPSYPRLINERFPGAINLFQFDQKRPQQAFVQKNPMIVRLYQKWTGQFEYHQQQPGRVISLFRWGNLFRAGLITRGIILLGLLGFVGILLFRHFQSLPLFSDPMIFHILTSIVFFYVAFVGAFIPISIWVNRRKTIQTEFMRPFTRKQFIDSLLKASIVDQWPGLLGIVIVISVGVTYQNLAYVTHAFSAYLCFLAWAATMMFIVFGVERLWHITIIFILLVVFAIMGTALVVMYLAVNDLAMKAWLSPLIAAPVITLAALMSYYMYRKALTREWGID